MFSLLIQEKSTIFAVRWLWLQKKTQLELVTRSFNIGGASSMFLAGAELVICNAFIASWISKCTGKDTLLVKVPCSFQASYS